MTRFWRRSVAASGVALLAASGPAVAGPPYITDDPQPVDLHHWEFYVFSAGATSSGDTSGLGPAFELNYGAAPGLQLHIASGFAYDAPAGQGLRLGGSDTELGTKYRFIAPDEDGWTPQVAVYPLIELPSGNAARGLGAGSVQAFLPVWVQKDFGKWTIYGGGGYWINPGVGNRNYWFTGLLIQREIFEGLAVGVEGFHQTSPMAGRDGTFGFNVGAVYDVTEHYHLLASVGEGGVLYSVDAGHATRDPVTYYVGIQWTF